MINSVPLFGIAVFNIKRQYYPFNNADCNCKRIMEDQ